MKNNIGLLVGVIVAALLFVGAYFLYGSLSEKHSPDRITTYESEGDNAQSSNSGNTDAGNSDNRAPDFTVYDEDGNEVRLSDYFGKPIVINFWATWCGYCIQEMPDFNEAYKNHPDVEFLMINATDGQAETVEKASAYVEEQGFEFPVFYDENMDAVIVYGVTGYPQTVFIDENGSIVSRAEGMINSEDLERCIEMIK